jgi:hypothetical protein
MKNRSGCYRSVPLPSPAVITVTAPLLLPVSQRKATQLEMQAGRVLPRTRRLSPRCDPHSPRREPASVKRTVRYCPRHPAAPQARNTGIRIECWRRHRGRRRGSNGATVGPYLHRVRGRQDLQHASEAHAHVLPVRRVEVVRDPPLTVHGAGAAATPSPASTG